MSRIPTMPQDVSDERIPTMPQGVSDERIPTMPQGVSDERIPTMPQGASDERIPTMPQGVSDERIPTMPQGVSDERIPTMPQGVSEERVPTMPQGFSDGRVATMPQGADGNIATVPQGDYQSTGGNVKKRIIVVDTDFTGEHGEKFRIHCKDVISLNSGESQIYKCDCGDNNEYVARILISVTPSSDIGKRRMRDKVIDFLYEESKDPNSHILPLIEYGKLSVESNNYYVEIYPYCSGGDLSDMCGKVSYEELKSEYIPGINEAIHRFHQAKFVHRDLKPDNLYKYNGKIVVGDFGITSDLGEDGFATDNLKMGTLGYFAPELMFGAAVAQSDYYSFGQTLWSLYNGEMMYMHILKSYASFGQEKQLDYIKNAMMTENYHGLENIKKSDAFFEVLIRGLLMYSVKDRFSYDKVNRWLKGDKSLSNELKSENNKQYFKQALRVGNTECWDNDEMTAALFGNWEQGKKLLYSGVLKNFYGTFDFVIATLIDTITAEYTKNNNDLMYDCGFCKLLHNISSDKNIFWRKTRFSSFEDISIQLEAAENKNDTKTADDINELLSTEMLIDWYKESADGETDSALIGALNTAKKLAKAQKHKKAANYYAEYIFSGDEKKIVFNGFNSFDALADSIFSNKTKIYTECPSFLQNNRFIGFMYAIGHGEAVKYLLDNSSDDTRKNIELLYDFFETQSSAPALVAKIRKHYNEFGPNSYLTWWKNNLSLYTFNGRDAEKICSSIKAVNVNPAGTLNEQRKMFAALSKQAIEFRSQFLDNAYLLLMGFTKGTDKKGVFSDKLAAYWHYDFFGTEAPLGFNEYLGI